MSTLPHLPPARSIEMQAVRAAASRIARVARDHGTLEAMAEYQKLSPDEQLGVVVQLARIAGNVAVAMRPLAVDNTPSGEVPLWTDDELRNANRLYCAGVRSPWVVDAYRVYRRRIKRRQRAARERGERLPVGRPIGGSLVSL